MKKLDERGRAIACDLKPTLRAEFERCTDVWELSASTTSTGKMGTQSLFIGKYKPHKLSPAPYYKVIMSTRPTSTKPDGVFTWVIDTEDLGVTSSKGGRPVQYGDNEREQAKKPLRMLREVVLMLARPD